MIIIFKNYKINQNIYKHSNIHAIPKIKKKLEVGSRKSGMRELMQMLQSFHEAGQDKQMYFSHHCKTKRLGRGQM
jgi:hypothetical protein